MDITQLRDFCLGMEGVEEKTPFGKFARRFESVLVFYVSGRMFCLADMDRFDSVTVKSTPEETEELRASRTGVGAPLNPAMKDWIRLDIGADLTDSEIFALVSRAYRIVREKQRRRRADC